MVIMATIWRAFTYYIYLFIGAIVVPNWINKIIKRNRAEAKIKLENKDNLSV